MAVGDIVGVMVAVGGAATSFVLINNPGGFFAISGSNLIEAVNTPDGIYPITIKAIGPGYQATTSFSLDFTGGQPPPVGEFFLGLNLSGLEDNAGPPTQTEMAYWVSLGVTTFRIPLTWFQIQPFALGPLSPTYVATFLGVMASAKAVGAKLLPDFHNFGGGPGINGFTQTGNISATSGASRPWFLASSGASPPTATANATQAPDGSVTAAQLVFPAVSSAGTFSLIAQELDTVGGTLLTWSTYLKGSVGGEIVYIGVVDDNINYSGQQQCVLSTSWQRFSFSGLASLNNRSYFCIGTDLRNVSESATSAQTIFATWAQVNAGATAMAYAPGVSGGYKIGSVGLPQGALANAWRQFAARLRADPNFDTIYGYDFMNEWEDMDPNAPGQSTLYSQTLILQETNACIAALRADGDSTLAVCEWDHFSGAWDAVANNIELLFTGVVDPDDNWIAHVHCYLDQDSSGTHYIASQVFGQPSTAPPGINVTIDIGPERMAAVVVLAQQHGVLLGLGESGWSCDFPQIGGAFNYAEWNQAAFNLADFCRQNKVPFFAWASGQGFNPGSYPYDPVPTSNGNFAVKDFSSNAVQAPQVVIIDQFTGYSGPQAIAYRSALPVLSNYYTPSGQPLSNISIYYGGVVPSPVTFTGKATLMDGVTDVGGAFSAISYPAGQNGVALFSYTPSGAHPAINLTFTNNAGLVNPPAIGLTSQTDFFNTTIGAIAPNLYFLRLLNTQYINDAVSLIRADGAVADFRFTVPNAGGVLGLDRNAIQTWAGSRTIAVVTWQNQFGGNDLTPPANSMFLVLDDGTGYPSIHIPTSAGANFGTPTSGNGQLTIYTEINPANNNIIVSQDQPVETFRFTPAFISVSPLGGSPTFATLGLTLNTWSTGAATYSNLYTTNNLKTYINGSVANQVSAPAFLLNPNQNQATFGTFQFFATPIVGFFRGLGIQYLEYSAANLTALNTNYTNYYSTPLGDTLAPLVQNASNQLTVSGTPTNPFSTFSIVDTPGSTVSVVFTLSGHAAALSGTGLSGSNPYTLASDTVANINTKMQALAFLTTGSGGDVTTINIAVTSNITGVGGTSITDTIIVPSNPTIFGMVGPNVSSTQGAPPLWQVVVTDTNPTPMVSASIAVSGSAGTMSHIGPYAPSGTGPYTFSAMTPDQLTRALRNLLWLPTTTTVGTITTFTLTVTNALTLTASASNAITNIAAASMPSALTPVATPAALPRSFKGLNLSGGENFPVPNYQTSSATWSWPNGKGLNTVRLPFAFGNIQANGQNTIAGLAGQTTFTGTISGNTLTVTSPPSPYPLTVNQAIYVGGTWVGVLISSFGTGTGGVGTYTLGGSPASFSGTIQGAYFTFATFKNFRTGDVSSLQAGVELARQFGMYVILDNHDFGHTCNPFPCCTQDENSAVLSWGSDVRLPKEAFADCWKRMISLFHPYPNILCGLDNEPAWTGAVSFANCTTAINAIRTVSTTHTIYIPGIGSNVFSFNYTDWTGYSDPSGGPFVFDVHSYFDNAGGTRNTCQVGTVPSDYFGTFTTWCRSNGYKGTVTEFAWGTDTTCLGNANIDPGITDYFTTNNDVYIGWNWWGGGDFPTSYMFYMGGGLGTDPLQLPALTSNLGNTF